MLLFYLFKNTALYIYICLHQHQYVSVCMDIRMYMYMYIYICIYTYIGMYMCTVYTCVIWGIPVRRGWLKRCWTSSLCSIHIYIYIRIYIYTYVCVCMYIYIWHDILYDIIYIYVWVICIGWAWANIIYPSTQRLLKFWIWICLPVHDWAIAPHSMSSNPITIKFPMWI